MKLAPLGTLGSAQLAAAVGLPVAPVTARSLQGRSYLLVSRYDRRFDANGQAYRLHQEDFCQALGIVPERKYAAEGGPTFKTGFDLLRRATTRPAGAVLAFLDAAVFNLIVGNADAHGKNYALLYENGTPDLAPLYDVVCTAAYPRLSKKLAMKIGGRALPDTIQLKHWLTLVPDTKAAQRFLINDISLLAGNIEKEADALLLELSEVGIQHPVLKAVRGVIATRAAHLLRIIDRA